MEKIIRENILTEFETPERCFITEILNTDKFTGFSIAKARVLPGVTTELHTLRDTDEVYYILTGTGEMEIGNIGYGQVAAGDTVFIPGNTTQRIKNVSKGDLVFLCICSPRFEVKNYQ